MNFPYWFLDRSSCRAGVFLVGFRSENNRIWGWDKSPVKSSLKFRAPVQPCELSRRLLAAICGKPEGWPNVLLCLLLLLFPAEGGGGLRQWVQRRVDFIGITLLLPTGFLVPPARQLALGLGSRLGAWGPTVYLLGHREDCGIAFRSSGLLPAWLACMSVSRESSACLEASKLSHPQLAQLGHHHCHFLSRLRQITSMVPAYFALELEVATSVKALR